MLLPAATPVPPQPVYFAFYARITDHVNIEMTENRLRRVLSELDSYAQAHPSEHLTATIEFTGAVSRALAERNAQTHVVDFVRDHIHRGVIEAGYDGTDEPTYDQRPVIDLRTPASPEEKWQARATAAKAFLSQARDPLTGTPQPGDGGLKEMRDVFGPPVSVDGVVLRAQGILMRGVTQSRSEPGTPKVKVPDPTDSWPEIGGDSEIVQQLRSYTPPPFIMSGLYGTNLARLPGFGGGGQRFGDLMAPVAGAAPELFWQDNVLRLSEISRTTKPLRALDGPEALQKAMEKCDRSTAQVIRVELGGVQGYLAPTFVKGPDFPPLKYAYGHPQSPKLPADAVATSNDLDAAFAKEDAGLRWLLGNFLAANSGSRVVANSDLERMTAPSTGFTVQTEALRRSLADVLKHWGADTFPPPYVRVGDKYLSLADSFQVMTDALAEFHRTGKLPATVTVAPTYGPLRLLTGHGPNIGDVSVASIAAKCAEIAASLHDNSDAPVPRNVIPSFLEVDGITVNPAQFLRLMTAALVDPSPSAKIRVRMTYMLAESGGIYPKSRPLSDAGFTWTLKPAPLLPQQQAGSGPVTDRDQIARR
jgi:hypothetical protein